MQVQKRLLLSALVLTAGVMIGCFSPDSSASLSAPGSEELPSALVSDSVKTVRLTAVCDSVTLRLSEIDSTSIDFEGLSAAATVCALRTDSSTIRLLRPVVCDTLKARLALVDSTSSSLAGLTTAVAACTSRSSRLDSLCVKTDSVHTSKGKKAQKHRRK